MSRRRTPLARRVRWAMLAVATVSVLVVGVVLYVAWTAYTLSVRSDELVRQTQVIRSALAVSAGPAGPDVVAGSTSDMLLRVEAGLIDARLAVTDGRGAVLFSTAPDSARPTYPVSSLTAQGGASGPRSGVVGVPGVGRVLIVALPAGTSRYVVALQPVSEINRAQGPVLGLFVLSALLALSVAWVAGTLLARGTTGRLVRLTGGAQAVAGGEWGHQVPVEGDDEVASLATAFNDMSERVAEAYRSQKDFAADVSHELRTPMTSIRGFSGALLDGTVTDEASRRRYLKVIHDEAGRVMDVSATLLALADLDSEQVPLARVPVDVRSLADALRARHASPADAAGVSLEIGELTGTPLGDADRLLEAVSSLVDNAIAYTPEGGAVRVAAADGAGSWTLTVEDSGPGVAEQDRELIFRRFARLEASHSLDGGGTGLGLAICRRLLEMMGGSVRVEDSMLGGARFVVELPRAARLD